MHLYDADELLGLQEDTPIPTELLQVRPVRRLAVDRDPRLRQALMAERYFWQELDRLRVRLYRAALRPFVYRMGRLGAGGQAGLQEQHQKRLSCAEQTLSPNPIMDHGIDRLIVEARSATAALVQSELLQWLQTCIRTLYIWENESAIATNAALDQRATGPVAGDRARLSCSCILGRKWHG